MDPFPDPDSVTGLPPRPDGRRRTGAATDRARAWIDWFGIGRLLTAGLSVLVVVGGGIWLLRTPPPPTEAGLPYAASTSTSTSVAGAPSSGPPAVAGGGSIADPTATVLVHVAGAVAAPGVYTLPGGARVHAAIAAAGGPTRRADPGALNLAAALTDGERIYVPVKGEPAPQLAGPPGAGGGLTPPGPIDLNHASAVELDSLPGIGPATAAAIMEHRETNGPFASVDDLEAVRGIGPAKLEAIRDLVRV